MKAKIDFEDIFNLTDIEKTFEQTLEYDILQLMEKWHKEREQKEKDNKLKISPFEKSEQELYIREIVKQVLKEELANIVKSSSLFNEKFYKQLEIMGFERNCPTCCYNASKDYAICKID